MGANLFWRNTFKTLAQNPVTLRAMIAYRILWIFLKLYHYPAVRGISRLHPRRVLVERRDPHSWPVGVGRSPRLDPLDLAGKAPSLLFARPGGSRLGKPHAAGMPTDSGQANE